LFVGEVDGCAEVAKLEVLYKFVIGREAARRALEFAGIVPVEKLADGSPVLEVRHDRVARFEQRRRLGMPQARRGVAATGLEMEIKAGRVNVLARTK